MFDGDLSSATVPRIEGVISPSQLEAWAACPHAYFVHHLLRVDTDRGAGRPDQHHGERHRHHPAPGARSVPPGGHRRRAPAADRTRLDRRASRGADVDVRRRVRPRRAARANGAIRVLVRRTRTDAGRPARRGSDATAIESIERGSTVLASEHRFGADSPDGRPVGLVARGWSDDRPARHGRPHRPDSRWHDLRHRSQVRRGGQVQRPQGRRRSHARRHGVPTAGLCRGGHHVRRPTAVRRSTPNTA